MECKVTNKSELVSEIKINIGSKEWKEAVEKVYEKQKGKYEIQGWRKGKVPQKVIEQNYGNTIFWEDAITELANEGYAKAIAENKNFDPIGNPSLNVDKVDDNGVELTISVNVVPPVTLASYKGLTVKAPIHEFDEKMVDEELKHAQLHKTSHKPKEGKVAEIGDVVVLDFIGSVDGKEFDGGKAENHPLELGSHTFVDNFEDQLVGHKAGDKVEVKITFPKDYGAPALAGKEAKFDCEIKSVDVKEVPALDDEFAKLMGDYKDFAEYREDVKKQIMHELEHKNKDAEENAILEQIVSNSKVTLPPVLVEQNLSHIMKDLEYRLAYQGINLEDYAKFTGTTVEKLKEERRADAENLTKTKLVLEALVKAENLSVSSKEVDAKLEEIAKMQDKSLEEVKKMFDGHRIDRIYSDILMSKLVSFLKENNKVEKTHVCDEHCCCHEHSEAKKPATKKATTKTSQTASKKTSVAKTETKVASKKVASKTTANKATASKATANKAKSTSTAKTSKAKKA